MIGVLGLLLLACNPDSEVVNVDDDSDDITQEVFVKVWKKRKSEVKRS